MQRKVVQHRVKKGQTLMWSCCPEAMDVGLELKCVTNGKTDVLFNEAERVRVLARVRQAVLACVLVRVRITWWERRRGCGCG